MGGICGPENLVSFAWADGTADRNGDLTIVAPHLSVNSRDPNLWVLVQPLGRGDALGGVRGPFIDGGSRASASIGGDGLG